MNPITLVSKKVETESFENLPDTESIHETSGFSKRFPTVKGRVLSILKNDKHARENYLWLCLVYWAKCGHIKVIIPKDKFNRVNSPESITRAMRDLVAEAKHGNPKLKFLLNEEILDRREGRRKEMTAFFSRNKNYAMSETSENCSHSVQITNNKGGESDGAE